MQTISVWQPDPLTGLQLHGLEAIFNPWNVVLGVTLLFLARTTALLYFINNIDDEVAYEHARKSLLPNAVIFVVPVSYTHLEVYKRQIQCGEPL